MDHYPVPYSQLPEGHQLTPNDLRLLCGYCNRLSATNSLDLNSLRRRVAEKQAPHKLAAWKARCPERVLTQIELQLMLGQNPVVDQLRNAIALITSIEAQEHQARQKQARKRK